MLILFPMLVILEAYILIFEWRVKQEEISVALRSSLIYASAGLALFTFLATEGLSLVNALTRVAMIITWGSLALLGGYAIWLRRGVQSFTQRFTEWYITIRLGRGEKLLLVGMGLYLAILFVIAVVAPPNNNDSLQYHLARILHWIENRDLNFFPVVYLAQLFNPPGAEVFLLHSYLLVGSDLLLNLQQWFFMLASLVVVSLITKTLGAGRKGQWLAVIFLLCLPIGILEATSTQNDYVMTFWVVCLVYLVVRNHGKARSVLDVFSMGCLAGLAMWTKIPAYSFVAVVLIWATMSNLRIEGLRRVFVNSLLILALLFTINLPWWARNMAAFGNPLGDTDFVGTRTPVIRTPFYFLTSPLQHLSLNFGTPIDSLNRITENAIISLCARSGGTNCSSADENEWGFRIIGLSNHEDSAGNLLHVALFLCTLVIFATRKKMMSNPGRAFTYLVVIVCAFLLHSWLIAWGAFWVRLQLPLFAMGSVLFGLVWETTQVSVQRWLLTAMLLLSLPWLLLNRTRPVIGMTPDVTLVGSIFTESRETLMFANYLVWEDQVRAITSNAQVSGCKRILLRIDSRDPEYYFTYYLDPLHTGIHFEVESDIPSVQKYQRPGFQPCAVICAICGYNPDPSGMLLTEKVKGMTLYLSPEYYENYKKR